MKKFDVIVVGAGPAGSAASLYLAREGLKVITFERGEYPGSKTMSGGVLYGDSLAQLVPNFWEEAPLERYITKRAITFLSEHSSLTLDFQSNLSHAQSFRGFSLFRSKFDQWLAKKAEEAGAVIMTETLVDDLIRDRQGVAGVKVRRAQGEVLGHGVIVADGVNSLLAKKLGWRQDFSGKDLALGIKEIIKLPPKTIEERFNLKAGQGLAHEYIGYCTRGIPGGAFLYTNKSSLCLGVVVRISPLAKKKMSPSALLNDFKGHPSVAALIQGGTLKEYSAHMVPERGYRMIPRLYGNGLLIAGAAAGFTINTGTSLEGINLAIASGIAAAKAMRTAFSKGDFSSNVLCSYEEFLEESYVLRDLRAFEKAPQFFDNPSLYTTYPDLFCRIAQRIFTPEKGPKKKLISLVREEMRDRISIFQIIRDWFKGIRSL